MRPWLQFGYTRRGRPIRPPHVSPAASRISLRRSSRIQNPASAASSSSNGRTARTCPWRFASSTTPSRPTKRNPSRRVNLAPALLVDKHEIRAQLQGDRNGLRLSWVEVGLQLSDQSSIACRLNPNPIGDDDLPSTEFAIDRTGNGNRVVQRPQQVETLDLRKAGDRRSVADDDHLSRSSSSVRTSSRKSCTS